MTEKRQAIQRRTPKQARALQKYNAVLDACTQVLLADGYKNVTILSLSLEADVAIPTIYQYFENKEAIFEAWIDRVMDQVLQQVAEKESEISKAQMGIHVDQLIRAALIAVNFYRPGLQKLLSEIPNALSSKVISLMESKTIYALKRIYPTQFSQSNADLLEQKLMTLIRVITGYFIQAILNNQREMNHLEEAKELSHLVLLYLEANHIDFVK